MKMKYAFLASGLFLYSVSALAGGQLLGQAFNYTIVNNTGETITTNVTNNQHITPNVTKLSTTLAPNQTISVQNVRDTGFFLDTNIFTLTAKNATNASGQTATINYNSSNQGDAYNTCLDNDASNKSVHPNGRSLPPSGKYCYAYKLHKVSLQHSYESGSYNVTLTINTLS